MAIDPSQFKVLNVTDTCAIWNLLSSDLLFNAAVNAQCSFCCTRFVLYECLYKKRSTDKLIEHELRQRLIKAQSSKHFVSYDLDISDLQNVAVLEKRKNLSKGELASIAFAMKTRQAFLTDDQKARKLAVSVLGSAFVQTTPHLYGWLHFQLSLTDADHGLVLVEHVRFERPLSKHLTDMYEEALRCRLMATPKKGTGDA